MAEPVHLAIIGAGSVGSELARGWVRASHPVTLGVRNPDKPEVRALVEELGGSARAVPVAEAVGDADVVVLAVPWSATEEVVGTFPALDGKIVVDATNPLTSDLSGHALDEGTSGAEQVQSWAPGARVVKAFNTIGSHRFNQPQFGAETASMFVAGDDADAKEVVLALADELGFDPVDVGALQHARQLEHLALLWIRMTYVEQAGNIAFRLIRD
jgi:predicted dinucleotide-binding enzyme